MTDYPRVSETSSLYYTNLVAEVGEVCELEGQLDEGVQLLPDHQEVDDVEQDLGHRNPDHNHVQQIP